MTGPEHYRKAEELLREAALDFDGSDRQHAFAVFARERAQVHATLALAAATAAHAGLSYEFTNIGQSPEVSR